MELEDIPGAWLDYKETNNRFVRNQLAEHYQYLVEIVARKVGRGLPAMVDRNDLISYGNFGLLDAIEKFDLAKEIKFETYAVTRVKGAILDELRKLDWVPRTIRSKAREVNKANEELSIQLGRDPEDTELAIYLGIEVQDLWAIQSQQAMTYVSDFHWHDDAQADQYDSHIPIDITDNPEQDIMVQDLGRLLAGAIENMSERAKVIMTLYYCHEMTLAEIANILGVTVSRVCQIQSKILQQLREELGHGAAQMVA